MNYPLISEYLESIKQSEDNFNVLCTLCPVYDEAGEIVMSSGNFAVVFKMKDESSGKLYAVKCFLKEQEGRDIAYQQITDELEYVSSNYLCSIKYFQKELFVDSTVSSDTEFPVLLMDWVEGVTLDKYVHQHISDKYALQLITYQFCRMAAWLMSQPFAHGDLKPDNILVTEDGALVLVDYDGMYVPAMQGQKARELGSPDYRHPLRTEDSFNEHIDDFPLALIGMSLKAIALDSSLLQNNDKSDSLLFSESDFKDIGECLMMKSLCALLNDAEFSKLYALFLLAHSQQELSAVSFRLFLLNKVEKPIEEVLSTEATDGDAVNLSNNPIIDVYTSRFDQYVDEVFPNSRPNAIEKLMSLATISEQDATQIFERWQHFYFIAYDPWDQWIPCSPNDILTVVQFKAEMSVEVLSFSFYTDEDTGIFCFEIGGIKGKVMTREVPENPMFSKFVIPYSGVYWLLHEEEECRGLPVLAAF